MSTYIRGSHYRLRYIRILSGSAICASVACVYREWNLEKLERVADKNYERDCTNRYYKMCRGVLPKLTTCMKIQDNFPPAYMNDLSLIKWRNAPLWQFLHIVDPDLLFISEALLSIESDVRTAIWKVLPNETTFLPFISIKSITASMISEVASYTNFDALMILTAWVRLARITKTSWLKKECVFASREIFAKVVSNTPQLYIRWPLLSMLYFEPIWFLESRKDRKALRLERLVDEIYEEEGRARSNDAFLPPKHLFRKLNKHELTIYHSFLNR